MGPNKQTNNWTNPLVGGDWNAMTLIWHHCNVIAIIHSVRSFSWFDSGGGGVSRTLAKLLNLHLSEKYTSFVVWVRQFVWNFKGTLCNCTQSILPIHYAIFIQRWKFADYQIYDLVCVFKAPQVHFVDVLTVYSLVLGWSFLTHNLFCPCEVPPPPDLNK